MVFLERQSCTCSWAVGGMAHTPEAYPFSVLQNNWETVLLSEPSQIADGKQETVDSNQEYYGAWAAPRIKQNFKLLFGDQ